MTGCNTNSIVGIVHPVNTLENKICVAIMAVIAIFATIKLFCFQNSATRPFSVTFIWIVIDLAIFTYFIAIMTTIVIVKHPGEAHKKSWVYWTGYECYYTAMALNLIFHWAFAMEYLRTVIKLPIILDIFST